MAVFDCLKLQWMGSNTTKLWTSKKVVFELLFFCYSCHMHFVTEVI